MHALVEAAERQPGWQASLCLGFDVRAGRSVLAERARKGPLAVQRPFYPEGDVCHVYLLHPPGGVVGGDRIDIETRVGQGAHALVTTPGATKFYRSGGATAFQRQVLLIEDGASLEWLPQENIFFPGAEVALDTRIELHGDARIAYSEIQCLGRPVIGEPFDVGRVDSRLVIRRDGVPLMNERLRVRADNRCRLSLMAGMAVGGTLVISHAGEQDIDACRDLLFASGTDYAGATLIEDLLVVRYLGNSTENAHRLLRTVWQRVRPATLGRAASPPRIWAT
ncbi:MAG: urease accessory protein UreD [Gammaproteobacteria bacterium]|nr:urease accessory protein UreD [Gammaproteobacteria bacterium]